MKRTIAIIILAASLGLAGSKTTTHLTRPTGDNSQNRVLSQAEMQDAYNMSVERISHMLKAPVTAQYMPIGAAFFRAGKPWGGLAAHLTDKAFRGAPTIEVMLTVDAQNSFSALLRNTWQCRVIGPGANGGNTRLIVCMER